MRRLLTVSLAALAATSLAGTTIPAIGEAADAAAARTDAYGTVRNILPPGQSGTVDALELAQVAATDPLNRVAVDGENAPENFADQLEMYDLLNRARPAGIDRGDLSRYYKDAGFTPNTVVRSATPRPGVSIEWDEFGVPYVRGDTYADTMFGAGFAGTLDRMFLMDVLRHAGAARIAEFVGGSEANIEMDRHQLQIAHYTRQEAARQVVRLARRHGDRGARLLTGADAFLAGINAAQGELCPAGNVLAPSCPAEYAALQKTPEPWVRSDLTYVASLVGGIFGKGGGHEFANAIFFQKLRRQLGERTARRIYAQLRSKNDADAPTTASVQTPYGGGALRPQLPGVALPDVDGRLAPGTGHRQGATTPIAAEIRELRTGVRDVPSVIDGPFGPIQLGLGEQGMSNAVLVGAGQSRTGHPLAVFGPQTGYYTPQLLTEQVLIGPGVKVRGVSFAGTQLVVQLGRGVDYAWSATSASNDLVDTVVEPLCNRDGSKATVHSRAYVRAGRCVPMRHFTHSETVLPNPADPSPPEEYRFDVWRTHHGIVQVRTTVDGRPVAIVLQRSTYGHEVDSILGFAQLNNPRFVHDAASFQRAVSNIDYTFNWFYADDRDISYFSSGKLPVRAAGTDYDLPRWGQPRYDWNGWLSQRDHVAQTNPPSGYLVNWNNKIAPGFSAADSVWGYGSVYRSLALEDRIHHAIRGTARVGLADVVWIVADAATVDSRARYTLPLMLDVIGADPATRAARRLLGAWLADGAHRVDRDRDGSYAHEQAIALFDTWWQDGGQSVAYDLVGDRIGSRLARQVPVRLDDHPRQGVGSTWNNGPFYGYVNTDLRDLLGRPIRTGYALNFCGEGDLAACRATLRASLRAAVTRALVTQNVDRVGQLRYDKTIDDIRSTTAGVVGVRPIDWQNRPTFQQVVAYTDHRSR